MNKSALFLFAKSTASFTISQIGLGCGHIIIICFLFFFICCRFYYLLLLLVLFLLLLKLQQLLVLVSYSLILNNNGNVDDVFAFLSDHKIPADEVTLYNMAEEILKNPPLIGYLTISNALQWRLQYGRIVSLNEDVDGITTIVKYVIENK